MLKKSHAFILISLFIVAIAIFWFSKTKSKTDSIIINTPTITPTLSPTHSTSSSPTTITSAILDVPYINEAPSNNWTSPWKNACEEASIAMVDFFYTNKQIFTIPEAEAFMQALFDKQDALYGSNANADAEQINNIINNYSSFHSTIVRKPTIESIKNELDNNRPVISLHYGFDLHNPNIPFLQSGTSYHTMVIIGYDDSKNEFIVNDDGDSISGAKHRYDYDLFMNSLGDYNHSTNKVDGPPTVLFSNNNN